MDNGKKKKKKIVIFEPLDELGPLLLSSQCGPTRVRLVDEQLVGRLLPGSGAVEQPDEATCSQVVGLLMSTLRLWFDPKSVQSVQRAVSTLARQNPALCVPVLADMSTRMSKRTFGDKSKSPDRDGRVALNLAGVHAQLLLALAPDVEKGLGEQLQGLLQASVLVLNRTPAAASARSGFTNTLRKLLENAPALLPLYLKIALAEPAKFLAALAVLLDAASAEALTPFRGDLLKQFDTLVLEGKAPSTDGNVAAFAGLLRTLTHDEMKAVIVPTVARLLKRGPDTVLAALSRTLEHVSLDLSQYHQDWTSAVLDEARHAKDERRAVAITFIGQLVRRTSDPAALEALLDDLCKLLQGKSKAGRLAGAPSREGVARAIEAVAKASEVPEAVLSKLAASATSCLLTQAKSEANLEAKSAAIAGAKTWFAALKDVPADVAALVVGGMDAKGKAPASVGPVCAYMELALLDTNADGALYKAVSGSTKALEQHIAQAKVKATQRATGIAALALLLRDDAAWLTVAPYINDVDSFVNRPDAISKAGSEQGLAHAALARAVLTGHSQRLLATPDDFGAFLQGLVSLLVQPEPAVRSAAKSVLSKAVAVEEGVGALLVAALLGLLQNSTGEANGEESYRWYLALQCVASRPTPALLPTIALIAHHPFLCLKKGGAWVKLQQSWARNNALGGVSAADLLAKHGDAIQALLLSPRGLMSVPVDEVRSQTCSALLATLASTAPALFSKQLLPALLAVLDSPSLLAASSYEQAVVDTPAGELCKWDDGTYKAEAVDETHNIRKGKGNKGLYDDAEFERMIAAEKSAKERAKKMDAESAAKLVEEDAIRQQFAEPAAHCKSVLGSITALARSLPRTVHELVTPAALPKLNVLLSNTITARVAAETHRGLVAAAASADKPARPFCAVLARAALLVLMHGSRAYSKDEALLNEALQKMADVADNNGGAVLSPSTFMLTLPLLSVAIESSRELSQKPGLTAAMNFLCHHCQANLNLQREEEQEEQEEQEEKKEGEDKDEKPTVLFPCSRMLDLLLHAMGYIGSLQYQAHDALMRLCPALALDDLEPLLGDAGLLSAEDHVKASVLAGLELVPLKHAAPVVVEEQPRGEQGEGGAEELGAAAPTPGAAPAAAATRGRGGAVGLGGRGGRGGVVATRGRGAAAGSGATRGRGGVVGGRGGVVGGRGRGRGGTVATRGRGDMSAPTVRGRAVVTAAKKDGPDGNKSVNLVARLWVVCHDSQADNSSVANALWTELDLKVTPTHAKVLLTALKHKRLSVRTAAARALAALLSKYPAVVEETTDALVKQFHDNPDEHITQALGMRVDAEVVYNDAARSGVGLAIAAAAPSLNEHLSKLFAFFMDEALFDDNDEVWGSMLSAGLKLIEHHGSANIQMLLPLFEERLLVPSLADRVREGVVVFMGTTASHLQPEDPKILPVLDGLVDVLNTPSYTVQKSAAECIAPLMALVKDEPDAYIQTCMDRLKNGADYGVRKGAAFGLAAMIKGLKLTALKKYNVLDTLAEYIKDKGNFKARQGALFAYERLFSELGSRFEPYVVHILPHLLKCFGDSNIDVREATSDAAKMIMSHLTGHGVKMILPLVLSALDEKSWRTRVNSVELLGAMAYCAPKQLSQCLPMIVPRLLDVMTDAKDKVQESAHEALGQIGGVIRNPEISRLVPQLMKALKSPADNTKDAVTELIKTSFVHSVDPASLALIVPILRRGLRDRMPITKKMSAQVVGSMCSLIGDTKDLIPYAPMLLKHLKQIIIDPNPEVRTTGAKALATLFMGIGKEHFVGLDEFFHDVLRGDSATVPERSGAAQGLAQLMFVQGQDYAMEAMPEVYEMCKHPNNNVREGYIAMFTFMPEIFGQQFDSFLEDVLPIVVAGLADGVGPVREVSLRAGQQLVIMFAQTRTDLLLPSLEDGIMHANWQIRLSSIQLLGTMLLKLAQAPGKLFVGDDAEEDAKDTAAVATTAQERLITECLGLEHRNELFATLYLLRSDTFPSVQQMAWRVWKCVVQNTPRMLAVILPKLMDKILDEICEDSQERQEAAGSALGELVVKMGDTVLGKIVPILQDQMMSPKPMTRRGVCLGLSQVMASAKKTHIAAYMQELIPAVRDALCDPEDMVRTAAGRAFETLYQNIGRRAIDEVVPSLIEQLPAAQDPAMADEAPFTVEQIIEGVREILLICGQEVLGYLVPSLIQSPMSLSNARALETLSDVLGSGIHRYVSPMVESLIAGMTEAAEEGDEAYAAMREASGGVVGCITQNSIHVLVEALVSPLLDKYGAVVKRRACAHIAGAFCKATECDFSGQVPNLLQGVLQLYGSDVPELQTAGVEALDVIIGETDKDDLCEHVEFIRSVIEYVGSDAEGELMESMPGFVPKGALAPILVAYQHALMNGSPDVRENAALGLGELVQLTPVKSLSPYVIKITGPLIRIVGDRFPSTVKAAILGTLGRLLTKTGASLKPFLPQLQTTFVKALHDDGIVVRRMGAAALGDLMLLSRRVDPLITELGNMARDGENPNVRASALQALVNVLKHDATGKKVSAAVHANNIETLTDLLGDEKDDVRSNASSCVGVSAKYLPDDELAALAETLTSDVDGWRGIDGRLAALAVLVKACTGRLTDAQRSACVAFALAHSEDDNLSVKDSTVALCSALLCTSGEDAASALPLLQHVCSLMGGDVQHLRTLAATTLAEVASRCPELASSTPALKLLVPALLTGVEDSNGGVRRASMDALGHTLQFSAGKHEALVQQYLSTEAKGNRQLTARLNNAVAKLIKKQGGGEGGGEDAL